MKTIVWNYFELVKKSKITMTNLCSIIVHFYLTVFIYVLKNIFIESLSANFEMFKE